MAILSIEKIFIAIEGIYASIGLARLAKASNLSQRNSRVVRPIPVERITCNTGAVRVKVRLFWFAQFAGKIIKLVKNGLDTAVPSAIGRVFEHI
jgi:hypothetical protein